MSKPEGPGVMRASMVLVWHAGQGGRKMIMMLRLGSGGSVTELSVTGRCRSGAVIKQPWNLRTSNAVPFCSLSKVNDLGLKSDHRAMDQTAPARRGTRVGAIWGSAEGAALRRFGCERITPSWDALSSFAHFPNLPQASFHTARGRVGPGNCTLSPSQIPYVNLSIHTARVTA
jgi:hypothetical protein